MSVHGALPDTRRARRRVLHARSTDAWAGHISPYAYSAGSLGGLCINQYRGRNTWVELCSLTTASSRSLDGCTGTTSKLSPTTTKSVLQHCSGRSVAERDMRRTRTQHYSAAEPQSPLLPLFTRTRTHSLKSVGSITAFITFSFVTLVNVATSSSAVLRGSVWN